MLEGGNITLAAFISPFKQERKLARHVVTEGDFVEIYVNVIWTFVSDEMLKGFTVRQDWGK